MSLEEYGVNFISAIPAVGAAQLNELIEDYLTGKNISPKIIEEDLNKLDWSNTLKPAIDFLCDPKNIGSNENPKVSVCLPTYNGEKSLELCMESLKSQAYVDIELCVIDSTSTDNSVKIIQKHFPDTLIKKIPKKDFNHGGTRNILIQMATSEYIFFLTQDVILGDQYLLRCLVTEVKNEKIALAFCRHVPYPSHNDFIKRDTNGTFSNLRSKFAKPSGLEDLENDPFGLPFSSNNACMYKKSLLSKYPFEMIVYGEDQVWTKMILNKGYLKSYLHSSFVIHSHDYSPSEIRKHAITQTAYFRLFHDHEFDQRWTDLKLLNLKDTEFAKKNEISNAVLKQRLAYNKALIEGRKLGLKATTLEYELGDDVADP